MLELEVEVEGTLVTLQFEHSLVSVSKWESRTKIAFHTVRQKSPQELIDYFKDMLLPGLIDEDYVYALSAEQMEELTKYINEKQTASSVPDMPKKPNYETMTSELIYYWMVEMGIPFEPTNTWHLSRLLMLIEIKGYKSQPKKKRPVREVWSDWIAQNEAQKKKLGITG